MRSAGRRGGFTLAEAMIAMVVLAVSVAAIAQAMIAAHRQTDAAIHDLRAISLAEEKLEELLALPYDNLLARDGDEETAGELEDAAGNPHDAAHQAFSRRVDVAATSTAVLGESVPGRVLTVTVADGARTWELSRFVPEPAP